MLAALLTGVILWQEPPTGPPKEPAPPPSGQTIETWDDKKAKSAVEDFNKALKGAASMAQRTKALELVAAGSSKLLVKPLAQVVETDRSVVIRKQAAALLANQPAGEANATIVRLVKSPRLDAYPTVQAELVRGLARCAYQPKQWSDIGELFERTYHLERVPLQEAILDLVIAAKELQAMPLLLRNLDEPVPENVDAADNPPAEYWRARWESWAVWRPKVKEALFALTGQRFSTAAEAKAWLKKNPPK
jgi:hypothetical protein